jgi:hypothetical protein
MEDLCKILRGATPEIVSRWEEQVNRSPWNQLSEPDRLDELPMFLDALFNWTVCGAGAEGRHLPFLHAAASHGEQRRRLGLSYDHIMEESALLRRAVWEIGKPHTEHFHEMARIDSALTVGLMASLRGYSKQELEARGDWDSTLARLASDWTALLRN